MHNKTEKFIRQLRHTMHGKARNQQSIQVSANQSA